MMIVPLVTRMPASFVSEKSRKVRLRITARELSVKTWSMPRVWPLAPEIVTVEDGTPGSRSMVRVYPLVLMAPVAAAISLYWPVERRTV